MIEAVVEAMQSFDGTMWSFISLGAVFCGVIGRVYLGIHRMQVEALREQLANKDAALAAKDASLAAKNDLLAVKDERILLLEQYREAPKRRASG